MAGEISRVVESFQSLDRLLQFGLIALLVALGAVLTYALLWLRRSGILGSGAKKSRPLPKHKVPVEQLHPKWEETNYNNMVESVHREIHAALLKRDRETLEVFCQGAALKSLLPRLEDLPGSEDRREVLQGSVRQSWDAQRGELVTILAVSRWVKSWRRFYEKWTLQKQGNAWFLVAREASREPL